MPTGHKLTNPCHLRAGHLQRTWLTMPRSVCTDIRSPLMGHLWMPHAPWWRETGGLLGYKRRVTFREASGKLPESFRKITYAISANKGLTIPIKARPKDLRTYGLTKWTLRKLPAGPLPVRLPYTFRKLPGAGKTTTWSKLPVTLPETFRNLPELRRNQKMTNNLPVTLPETFRNLPELR